MKPKNCVVNVYTTDLQQTLQTSKHVNHGSSLMFVDDDDGVLDVLMDGWWKGDGNGDERGKEEKIKGLTYERIDVWIAGYWTKSIERNRKKIFWRKKGTVQFLIVSLLTPVRFSSPCDTFDRSLDHLTVNQLSTWRIWIDAPLNVVIKIVVLIVWLIFSMFLDFLDFNWSNEVSFQFDLNWKLNKWNSFPLSYLFYNIISFLSSPYCYIK